MGDYYMGGYPIGRLSHIPQHMTTFYDLATPIALHFYPHSTQTSVTR